MTNKRVPSVGEIVKTTYEIEDGRLETIDYTIEDVVDPEHGPVAKTYNYDIWEVYVDDAEGKLRRVYWSETHDCWVEEGAFG